MKDLRIIGIEEGKASHSPGPENTFNKITEENFFKLRKEKPINKLRTYRTLDQERKSLRPRLIKA